jgi:DNA ligase-1
MSLIKRPTLAEKTDGVAPDQLWAISNAWLATPKLDGIRCLIVDGVAVSRKFKPIPNRHIRETLAKIAAEGMDGEIICPGKTFNEIQSLVMSQDGEPEFEFHVFDYVQPETSLDDGYETRLERLKVVLEGRDARLVPVYPTLVLNHQALTDLEARYIAEGYEGVMIRRPGGKYKCNRSTLKEGLLLKIKQFADSEAEIIGFSEQMTNTNEKVENELGLSKRSTEKEGMVPAGRLGEFLVRDIHTGQEFRVGTGKGLTLELRKTIWDNQASYLGKIFTYTFQPAGGKDLPRFPVWKGFRDAADILKKEDE